MGDPVTEHRVPCPSCKALIVEGARKCRACKAWVAERLQRGAFDIGARISPDMVDEERRAAFTERVERVKRLQAIQREMMSAARHAVVSARSEPGQGLGLAIVAAVARLHGLAVDIGTSELGGAVVALGKAKGLALGEERRERAVQGV